MNNGSSLISDILIVDDEADIRTLVHDILTDEGYFSRTAQCAESTFEAIQERIPSLIVLDIWLQGSRMDGIEILKSVKQDFPELPVIIISGHGNIELAVEAIKRGAYDFIEKPFRAEHFLAVIRRALETFRLRQENAALRRKSINLGEIVGSSLPVKNLRAALDRVAPTESRVLFCGPHGSGKEVAARYVHNHSPRKNEAFVVFSAGSIDAENIDNVLFGESGTGRVTSFGLLERARGGTMLIDEVTDMPLDTQARILRIINEQRGPHSGKSGGANYDIRFVSSTNRDLENEVRAGRFREDLFHRLNVVRVEVPPLAARREDIAELFSHLTERLVDEHGYSPRQITGEALTALQIYDWPGNISQLKNVIERLLIFARDRDKPVEVNELPAEVRNLESQPIANPTGGQIMALPMREAREAFEKEYLRTQINRFAGNVSRTAAFVGMERSALHRKLKSLNVENEARQRRK